MGRQIIVYNDIALFKGRRELCFEVFLECITVHGALDDPRLGQAVTAQPGNDRHGFPVTMGNAGNRPPAFETAPNS